MRHIYKLLFALIILGSSNNLMAQTKLCPSIETKTSLQKELKISGDFVGIHYKTCPGQLSGDKNCIRTLYLMQEISDVSLKSIKKGEYRLKDSDIVVIYDRLGAQLAIQLSDLPDKEKVLLLTEIEERGIGDDIVLVKDDFLKYKRRKNKMYVTSLKNEKALLFKADISFFNEVLRNRVKIITDKSSIPFIIFY